MKHCSKKIVLFSLILLLNYGNNALSYTFNIINFTGQDVTVRLHWAGGTLNDRNDLIKAYYTRKFSWKLFDGWGLPDLKGGYCLTSIKVSTKISGKWLSPKSVQIQTVDSMQFKEISEAGFIGAAFGEGLKFWKLTGCGSKDFILVTDPSSEKILAITTASF